jgi:hypothetical protein
MTEYLAGGQQWLYPEAGDEQPPLNTKILLLTAGGIATTGNFHHHNPKTPRYPGDIAWQRLPSRDKTKDDLVTALRAQARLDF